VRFDESRLRRHRLEIFENGIEPLDVADLNQAALALCELDQLRCLCHVVRHRLLDEQMFAPFEQRFRDPIVRRRRRNDVQRIAELCRLLDGTKRARVVFRRVALGRFRSPVENTGKSYAACRSHLRINARVFFAQRSGADDRHAYRILFFYCHAASLPLLRAQ
jgi:hypothetical protein